MPADLDAYRAVVAWCAREVEAVLLRRALHRAGGGRKAEEIARLTYEAHLARLRAEEAVMGVQA